MSIGSEKDALVGALREANRGLCDQYSSLLGFGEAVEQQWRELLVMLSDPEVGASDWIAAVVFSPWGCTNRPLRNRAMLLALGPEPVVWSALMQPALSETEYREFARRNDDWRHLPWRSPWPGLTMEEWLLVRDWTVITHRELIQVCLREPSRCHRLSRAIEQCHFVAAEVLRHLPREKVEVPFGDCGLLDPFRLVSETNQDVKTLEWYVELCDSGSWLHQIQQDRLRAAVLPPRPEGLAIWRAVLRQIMQDRLHTDRWLALFTEVVDQYLRHPVYRVAAFWPSGNIGEDLGLLCHDSQYAMARVVVERLEHDLSLQEVLRLLPERADGWRPLIANLSEGSSLRQQLEQLMDERRAAAVRRRDAGEAASYRIQARMRALGVPI